MSLASLSREEKAELVSLGLTEKELYFVESLIAKKQVVLLQEMIARARSVNGNFESIIKDEQRNLIKSARLLVMSVKPFKMGHWQSAYILAYWRHKDSRKVVREVL